MKHKAINVGLIGLGRIGKMHANNISQKLPFINLKSVIDPAPDLEFIQNLGPVESYINEDEVLYDNNIDAVIIASPTPTHYKLIKKSIKHNKHVFCEKPVSFSKKEIKEIIEISSGCDTLIQIGLNRRFDQDFIMLKDKIKNGLVGKIHMIHITNHDASIPKFKFLKSSGGMLFDLCIHDFDMLNFLTAEKIKEIYVNGNVFIEPRLKEIDDIDSAIITLELESGVLCSIDSSRQTHFGYDQRVEVFGSKGMVSVKNKSENLSFYSNEKHTMKSKKQYSFIERYQDSYIKELEHFYSCVSSGNKPIAGLENILTAIKVSAAGEKSMQTNNPEMVKL